MGLRTPGPRRAGAGLTPNLRSLASPDHQTPHAPSALKGTPPSASPQRRPHSTGPQTHAPALPMMTPDRLKLNSTRRCDLSSLDLNGAQGARCNARSAHLLHMRRSPLLTPPKEP
jgi:hypothetical protein